MDLKNKKFIGEGTYGKCYELSNGDILKVFKIPKDKYEIKKLESFSKIDTKTIIFPKELLILKNTLLGYSMRKAPGEKIYDNFKYYDLNKAALNTVNLEKDIIKISGMGIETYDIHPENIFYDGLNYSIIDTDEYEFCEINTDDLEYFNIKKISNAFIEVFIEELLNANFFCDKHYEFLSKLRFYKSKGYELNKLIIKLKNEIENYFNTEITTLSDIHKIKVSK